MDKLLHDPTTNFDFRRVSLKTPFKSGGGGGFFSKFAVEGEPFYIKTPRCTTKQGFVKSGKRFYCDLVLSAVDNDDFIQWMQNLEEHSQKILSEKSADWFQDPMTQSEIEDATINPLKPYRSSYLVRCGAGVDDEASHEGQPMIKAYDENAREISLADIRENMDVVALLELRGIKCALKSFQFEINVKQIMVVKKMNIMENCLLVAPVAAPSAAAPAEIQVKSIPEPEPENKNDHHLETELQKEPELQKEEPEPELQNLEELYLEDVASTEIKDATEVNLVENDEENVSSSPELEEINLEDFEGAAAAPTAEPIVLKNPNELYYNMYFDAKKRAKDARMKAITAYLEAKNIKMLYDLDDVEDSDDEEDFMDFTDDEGGESGADEYSDESVHGDTLTR